MTKGLDSYWTISEIARLGLIPDYDSKDRIRFKTKSILQGKGPVVSLDKLTNTLRVLHPDALDIARRLYDRLPEETQKQVTIDRVYPGAMQEIAAENQPTIVQHAHRKLAPVFVSVLVAFYPALNYVASQMPRFADSQVYVGLTNLVNHLNS